MPAARASHRIAYSAPVIRVRGSLATVRMVDHRSLPPVKLLPQELSAAALGETDRRSFRKKRNVFPKFNYLKLTILENAPCNDLHRDFFVTAVGATNRRLPPRRHAIFCISHRSITALIAQAIFRFADDHLAKCDAGRIVRAYAVDPRPEVVTIGQGVLRFLPITGGAQRTHREADSSFVVLFVRGNRHLSSPPLTTDEALGTVLRYGD